STSPDSSLPALPSCFFFQAEDGIRDFHVTGVQTCALPIYPLEVRIRVRQPNALNLLHRMNLCICCFRLPLKSHIGVVGGSPRTEVKTDSIGMNFATTSPTLRMPLSAGWIFMQFTRASMSAPHS